MCELLPVSKKHSWAEMAGIKLQCTMYTPAALIPCEIDVHVIERKESKNVGWINILDLGPKYLQQMDSNQKVYRLDLRNCWRHISGSCK